MTAEMNYDYSFLRWWVSHGTSAKFCFLWLQKFPPRANPFCSFSFQLLLFSNSYSWDQFRMKQSLRIELKTGVQEKELKQDRDIKVLVESKKEGPRAPPEAEIWMKDWEEAAFGQAGAKMQKLVGYKCKDSNTHKVVLSLTMWSVIKMVETWAQSSEPPQNMRITKSRWQRD